MNSRNVGLALAGILLLACGDEPGQDPDVTSPVVYLTAPADGATVAGEVVISAFAEDDERGIAGVTFRLDGVDIGTPDLTAPYSITWASATASEGVHQLTAVALDSAGNDSTSVARSVTVDNIVLSALKVQVISNSDVPIAGTARIAIDGGAPTAPRPLTGYLLDTLLVVGAHSVTISEMNPACILTGPSTVGYNVVAGATVFGTLTATCGYSDVVAIGYTDQVNVSHHLRLVDAAGTTVKQVPVDSSRMVVSVAVRPDGRGLAYGSWGAGTLQLRFQNLLTGVDSILTPEGVRIGDGVLAWSPDGAQLAFADAGGALRILSMGTGSAPLVPNGGNVHTVDWSPDGLSLAFTSVRDTTITVYRMTPAGTGLTAVNLPPAGKGDLDVQWSSDGSMLYFSSTRTTEGTAIWRMNADGGSPQQLTTAPGPGSDTEPRLSPSGTTLIFQRGNAVIRRTLAGGAESTLFGPPNTAVTAADWSR